MSEYVSGMSYEDALKVMQQARIRTPALVFYNRRFHAFEKTTHIGSGATLEAALESAGLLPIPERRDVVLFANRGSNVMRGEEPVCVARTRNMAHRIANALNCYTPNKEGY